jgi:hypothetical protein
MSIDKLSDYEPGAPGVVRRWLDELEIAGEWERDWHARCKEIIERYEGQLAPGMSTSFNILHSNVETLRPNLLGAVPQPDVRRRNSPPPAEGQEGPPQQTPSTDREAAELIERALRYMNDSSDYLGEGEAIITDLLLTGRGTGRIRYVPTMVRRREPLERIDLEDGSAAFFTANMNEVAPEDVIEEGEASFAEIEELHFERADMEHVAWDDFRHTPARRWQDVRWVAFRHYFSREELEQAFGKGKAAKTSTTVQVSAHSAAQHKNSAQPDLFSKAEVWEIWDKVDRKILFVSEGNPTSPLLTVEDGPEYYNLENFFPCPEPIRTISSPRSLLPIPEFVIYQDLADELDEITSKIRNIVDTIDLKGAYDGSFPQLATIFSQRERLVPIEDWRGLVDKNGLQGIIDFIPIDDAVRAFVALTEQRKLLLDTIYQTVGLSDLTRGQSDARETATAQRLKGDFGSLRMTPRQRNVQQYLRDLMRIQAELIAEKFEADTLELITGMDLSEEMETLLRVDALRMYNIDIETDSTVAVDQAAAQRNIAEMLEGLAAFGQAAQSLPDGARMPLLQSVVRRFKLGRDVETAIEEAANQPPAPDPEVMAKQADIQTKQAAIQQKEGASQRDHMIAMEELALKAREIAAKEGKAEADVMIALGQMMNGGTAGAA